MRHPIEKYNVRQAEVLASLPEENREWMARQFRIGNATYCYYNRVNELAVFAPSVNDSVENKETLEDLIEWLQKRLDNYSENRSARELLQLYFDEYVEGLPHDGLRRAERAGGLDKAKTSFPFRRYVLERHDIGMDEFLRLNLSADDYTYHVECSKPLTNDHESAE